MSLKFSCPSLCSIAIIASIAALTPRTAYAQSPAATAPAAAAVAARGEEGAPAKAKRQSIAVLSVRELESAGAANVTHLGLGDAILFSKAEEAVTKSRAYQLVGRDTFQNQMAEIKLGDDGFVSGDTKQLGKLIQADKFLTVFLSGATRERVGGESNSRPRSRRPGGFGGVLHDLANGDGTPGVNSRVTISCRFTVVETGERSTMSFTGKGFATGNNYATADSQAVEDAFGQLQKYLRDTRMLANAQVVGAGENFLRIGSGSNDGVKLGTLYEVFILEKASDGFEEPRLFSEACVVYVADGNAKLEFGQSEKKRDVFRDKVVWKGNDLGKHRDAMEKWKAGVKFEVREKK